MIWLALLATLAADDPPIRVTLSEQVFAPGERAKVRVRLADDGYLLVLRADAHGRIRVLFPIDPTDSSFAKGRRELSLLDRGGREGFLVDGREGSGIVMVARADSPFDFQAFTRGVHWDYRALAATDSGLTGEDALLDVLDRMATGDYHFDVVSYEVVSADAHRGHHDRYHGRGYGRPRYGLAPSF
jgi:hypothetical protein